MILCVRTDFLFDSEKVLSRSLSLPAEFQFNLFSE